MRRTVGYIALVAGLVLIFISPMLRWYAFPRVAKAPTDVYDVTVSNGRGSYFSATSLTVVGPINVQNIAVAKGDPKTSNDDVAVISIFNRTLNADAQTDIDYTQDVYAMDRVSGYAVHCCGERPRHEGLTLKFPFDTRRGTYQFYDSTAHKAYPATYVREQKVHGLQTYMFTSVVPPVQIATMALPGFLAGHPELTNVPTLRYYQAYTVVWVEPFTGAVIKAVQRNKQWLTSVAGTKLVTLADIHIANSPGSIEHTAAQIRTKYAQLRLVRDQMPVFGPIVGIVLIAVGLFLLTRRERSLAAPVAARPAAETTA